MQEEIDDKPKFDWAEMYKFLVSPEGRQTAKELLDHLELRKGQNVDLARTTLAWNKGIAGLVVCGAIGLCLHGSLDGPSTGVILSGALGYVLGSKK